MNDYGASKNNNTNNKKLGRNTEQNIHDTEVLSAFEAIGKAKKRSKTDKENKIDTAQRYLEGLASMLEGMSPEEIKSFRFSASFKSEDGVSISFRTRYRR